jgi:hypothetical protein
MSEEQSNFKVTDRRLFNADGTPRDVPSEETPPAQAATAPAQAPASSTTETRTAPPPATEPEFSSDEEQDEAEVPGVDDPASFLNFLMSIASNAAAALGMMEHPVTHQREVDLELGKHWIDVLGMLQTKTSGNLVPQEAKVLEGLLADLRMQYVSLANAKQSKVYSGRDIVGGK